MDIFGILQAVLVSVCILLGVIFLFAILLFVYIFYLVCTGEDNCIACPGYAKEGCSTCGVQRRKLREERRKLRKQKKAKSTEPKLEVLDLNESTETI